MKNEIFFVYGICNAGDIPIVWEVAAFDSEDKALEYIKGCTEAVNAKFNDELTRGFEIGDSISVQNRWDVHAQYTYYTRVESGGYSVDTQYRFRRVPLIHDVLEYNLKQGLDLRPSIKYDEDTDDEDYVPYTMISAYES